MRVAQTLALLLALATFFAGCNSKETPPSREAERVETIPTPKPEALLEKFFLALADSDAPTAIECTTGGELARVFVASQVKLNDAIALLGINALERFNDDAKRLRMRPLALSAVEQLEQVPVSVSVTGRTATWSSYLGYPMKLVLVDGEWKLNVAASVSSPDALLEQNQFLDAMAKDISDIAFEMQAGKFASVEDVEQELRQRRQFMLVEYSGCRFRRDDNTENKER